MNPEVLSKIISKIRFPIDDPRFYSSIFTAVAKNRKEEQAKDADNLKRVITEEYDEVSRRLDRTKLQESTTVRNILRTRRLANLLINDKGELNSSLLPKVITHLTNHLYSLGPQRQYDTLRQEQILKALTMLRDNKDLVMLLKKIGKPYSNPLAEQIIRETLQIPSSIAITDAHARRAVLSAWMCYLRQSIGSCFATAPAIIVHDEQPALFLSDIYELLGTGRLKRTFGGIEYSVPLSVSWGTGNLRKPLLLSKDVADEDSAVWYAPGLIVALDAVEMFEKEATPKAKIEATREKVVQAFPEWNDNQPYILTSPEEILSRILMKRLDITQKELDDYDHRPRAMIHSGLIMQPSHSGKSMGGKGDACAHFHFQFDQASHAFKSLTENALLRAWEYTIASFSETKSEFTRWNLYSSLGLGPNEPGGIGQCLFEIIKHRLDQYNQKVAELQIEYETIYAQIKMLESRAQHVSSESEAKWAKAEYQSRVNEFYTFEEIRNKAHFKAQLFAGLFNFLIETYDRLFPTYFQEVYDADLHEVKTGPYDDSPAGFRLLYKHGRGNTAQWTKISTPQEFVDALGKFFVATEREVASQPEIESIQTEISEIVTAIVNHVRTDEFLETAFHRMAAAHQTPAIAHPLEHLDRIAIKPWAYVSGGTLGTLLNCYYRREQKLTEVARWVENPMELLVYYVDTLKRTPPKVLETFAKDSNKSMIAHSPTHAFLVKPGFAPFKDSWQNEAYTYTWLRDFMIRPMQQFVDNLELDDEMIAFVIQKLSLLVPKRFRDFFDNKFSHMHGRMTASDLREYVVDKLEREPGPHYGGRDILPADEIDSALFSMMPLFPKQQLEKRLNNIWDQMQLPKDIRDNLNIVLEQFSMQTSSNMIGAQTLIDTSLALMCLATGATSLPIDCMRMTVQAAQKLGYAMPAPITFADTNWEQDLFAFMVNPGTGVLELWRVDPLGRIGAPMSIWKEWLNGSRKDKTWGLFIHPHEYTSAFPTIQTGLPGRLL